jgi:hypothetical protein
MCPSFFCSFLLLYFNISHPSERYISSFLLCRGKFIRISHWERSTDERDQFEMRSMLTSVRSHTRLSMGKNQYSLSFTTLQVPNVINYREIVFFSHAGATRVRERDAWSGSLRAKESSLLLVYQMARNSNSSGTKSIFKHHYLSRAARNGSWMSEREKTLLLLLLPLIKKLTSTRG